MAKIKSESTKYITIKETEYLRLIENTMIVEALKSPELKNFPYTRPSGISWMTKGYKYTSNPFVHAIRLTDNLVLTV